MQEKLFVKLRYLHEVVMQRTARTVFICMSTETTACEEDKFPYMARHDGEREKERLSQIFVPLSAVVSNGEVTH